MTWFQMHSITKTYGSNTLDSSKRQVLASLAEEFIPKIHLHYHCHQSKSVENEKYHVTDKISPSFKRQCMDSSFADYFSDIMVTYTYDSLSVDKYNSKSSSLIDALPITCSDIEDAFAIEDYFSIPSFNHREKIDYVDNNTNLTSFNFL